MEDLESPHLISDIQTEFKAYPEKSKDTPSQDYVNSGGRNRLNFSDFVERVTKVLLPDFFASEDVREGVESLKDLNCFTYHDAFVVRGIRMALDYPVAKQRWMSEFLTILYDAKVVTRPQLNRAFEKLIHQTHDIALDVPDAFLKIYTFLRCSIEDGIMSPSFESRLPEPFLIKLMEAIQNDIEVNKEEVERVGLLLTNLRHYKDDVKELVTHPVISIDSVQVFLSKWETIVYHHELVARLITTAMQRENIDRENVSCCLSLALGVGEHCLNRTNIVLGILRVLESVSDLKPVCPEAETLLAKFILRALADEILSQTFVLDCIRLNVGGLEGHNVLKYVKESLLKSFNDSLVVLHFHKIWLAEDQNCEATREFKKQVCSILNDHFDDLNCKATQEALDRLDVTIQQLPLFVKKALHCAMEKKEQQRQDILDLFDYLLKTNYIDKASLAEGFRMCQTSLPEFSVDVPKATDMFKRLTENARLRGLLV